MNRLLHHSKQKETQKHTGFYVFVFTCMLLLFCYTAYAERRITPAAAFTVSSIGCPAFLYLYLYKGIPARSKPLFVVIGLSVLFLVAYFILYVLRKNV